MKLKDVSCGVLTSTFDMLKPSTACSVSPCQHNNTNQCHPHQGLDSEVRSRTATTVFKGVENFSVNSILL